MDIDLLDLYGKASAWAKEKVAGADDLSAATPCDDWDVRALLNHMLDTQHYFLASAKGEDASLPATPPPELISDDPVKDFQQVSHEVMETFGQPGVIDKTGPSLGIASSDQLLHGWDLARATGQDTTMPEGLAETVYQMIHGRFTDEQRKGVFKPEVTVADDASPQDKLLAYTGRQP